MSTLIPLDLLVNNFTVQEDQLRKLAKKEKYDVDRCRACLYTHIEKDIEKILILLIKRLRDLPNTSIEERSARVATLLMSIHSSYQARLAYTVAMSSYFNNSCKYFHGEVITEDKLHYTISYKFNDITLNRSKKRKLKIPEKKQRLNKIAKTANKIFSKLANKYTKEIALAVRSQPNCTDSELLTIDAEIEERIHKGLFDHLRKLMPNKTIGKRREVLQRVERTTRSTKEDIENRRQFSYLF